MSNLKTLWINPDHIEYIWSDVEPLISKALHHSAGEISSTDILDKLLNKQMILLIGVEGTEILMALVAGIEEYPRKKTLRIITWGTKSGHDYESWMPMFPSVVETFAKSKGCSSIEAWARKGLAKKLNWDHEYTIVVKNI